MLIPAVSSSLQRHAPRDDVDYLRAFAGMVLTATVAVAAVVYIARGGNLVKLAPAP